MKKIFYLYLVFCFQAWAVHPLPGSDAAQADPASQPVPAAASAAAAGAAAAAAPAAAPSEYAALVCSADTRLYLKGMLQRVWGSFALDSGMLQDYQGAEQMIVESQMTAENTGVWNLSLVPQHQLKTTQIFHVTLHSPCIAQRYDAIEEFLRKKPIFFEPRECSVFGKFLALKLVPIVAAEDKDFFAGVFESTSHMSLVKITWHHKDDPKIIELTAEEKIQSMKSSAAEKTSTFVKEGLKNLQVTIRDILNEGDQFRLPDLRRRYSQDYSVVQRQEVEDAIEVFRTTLDQNLRVLCEGLIPDDAADQHALADAVFAYAAHLKGISLGRVNPTPALKRRFLEMMEAAIDRYVSAQPDVRVRNAVFQGSYVPQSSCWFDVLAKIREEMASNPLPSFVCDGITRCTTVPLVMA